MDNPTLSPSKDQSPQQLVVNPPISNKSKFPVFILIIVLFLVIIVAGGYYLNTLKNKSLPQNTVNNSQENTINKSQVISQSPTSPSALTPVYIGNYEVDVKISTDSPCNNDIYLGHCKSDIYLKDKATEKETYILTTNDVVRNDVRVPQYRDGYIFLVKRIGYNDRVVNYQGNWTDELWVYVGKDKGEKIYDSKGLTYDVNPDGSLIALLLYKNNSLATNSVTILSRNNTWKAKTYRLDDKQCNFSPDTPSSAFNLDLEKWQQNPSALWGVYASEYRTIGCYWKIDPVTAVVSYYPVKDHQLLFALNTDKLVALYIDKPPFVEEDQQKQWLATHSTYSLYLYSLQTEKSTIIDTFLSSSTGFIPASVDWISSTQLTYSSPKGKVTYILQD